MKKEKPRIGKAIVKQLLRKHIYVVTFKQAEQIKQKYIEIGMQLYHDRYCE